MTTPMISLYVTLMMREADRLFASDDGEAPASLPPLSDAYGLAIRAVADFMDPTSATPPVSMLRSMATWVPNRDQGQDFRVQGLDALGFAEMGRIEFLGVAPCILAVHFITPT